MGQNVVKQTKSTKPKTSKPLKASAKNTKSTNDTQTDAVKSRIERRRIIKSKDKESKPSADTITVRVKDQAGDETFFKIKNTTKMAKVFQAYATRKGFQESSLRFLLDGERIGADETPKSLELEDQDQIDCVLQQTALTKTSTSKPSKPSKPAKPSKPSKPSKPVPLQTTSGGAKLFLDGTVEFCFGGDAFLRPDGKVECLMNGNGFPSVKAQHLFVDSGKWYYECHLLTPGCMQIGWVTPNYTGDASQGNGVGDDTFSWAYDGYRQLRWRNGASESWSNKWKTGDTVCLALDCKRGELRFALNGQWPSHSDSIAF